MAVLRNNLLKLVPLQGGSDPLDRYNRCPAVDLRARRNSHLDRLQVHQRGEPPDPRLPPGVQPHLPPLPVGVPHKLRADLWDRLHSLRNQDSWISVPRRR